MDSDYSTNVTEWVTNGSHRRNIRLVLITRNLFHQVSSSRDISLNSKYTVVFKNPRDKTQIVHLARHVYTENVSSFHKTYVICHKCVLQKFKDLGKINNTARLDAIDKMIVWKRHSVPCRCYLMELQSPRKFSILWPPFLYKIQYSFFRKQDFFKRSSI